MTDVKFYFEDLKNKKQIRRLKVNGDILAHFLFLQDVVCDLFELESSKFEIKWKDCEGDLILIKNDRDLSIAFYSQETLEKTIFHLYVNAIEDEDTVPKKPETPQNNAVEHPLVVCDSCDKNVFGDRYKCLQCVNFDLCSSCNAAYKHPGHDMIKLVLPSHISREWVFLGARKFWRSMFGRCPSNFFEQFRGKKENETPKSPEGPDKEGNSPGFINVDNVVSGFLKGDFSEAQKVFSSFLKEFTGQMESCPFAATGGFKAEGNINVPKDDVKEAKATNTASPESVQEPDDKQTQAKVKVEAEVQTKSTETKDKSSETAKVIESLVNVTSALESNEKEDEIIIDPIKEKNPTPDNETSTCAEGWTFLHGDEAANQKPEATSGNEPAEPPKVVKYPELEELRPKAADSGDAVQSNDPKIINALIKMQAMGFTNEGGWLERLLSTKHGNINEALDALYPHTQRR